MSSKIKIFFRNFGIALAAIVLYIGVTETFMDVAEKCYPSPEAFLQNKMMLDSIATTFLLAVFSAWLYHISRDKKGTDVGTSQHYSPWIYVAIPILTLGLKGLTALWLASLTLGLDAVLVLEESLESHQETWAVIENQPYFWQLMSVVIVGPIVEEVLFRGLVFHYLEKIKTGWFPILISAIAFGLFHVEPVQCVYAAVGGIGLGIVYAYTRDLKIVILIHFLNNFTGSLPPMLDTEPVQTAIGVLSLIMILPTIVILARLGRGKSRKAVPVNG